MFNGIELSTPELKSLILQPPFSYGFWQCSYPSVGDFDEYLNFSF